MNSSGVLARGFRNGYPALNYGPSRLRPRSDRLVQAVEVLAAGTHQWVAPSKCHAISIYGKAQNGTPESGTWGYTDHSYNTYYYSDGTTVQNDTGTTTVYSATAPASYCTAGPSGTVNATAVTYTSQYCHTYTNFDNTVAATTGASAYVNDVLTSERLVTIPGGNGVPATLAQWGVFAVTPGKTYTIFVPSGGSLTLTYFK